MKFKPFILSAILGIIIFLLNSFAMEYSWYYYIWWFDMPMHFLGGLWVASISIDIFSNYQFLSKDKHVFKNRTIFLIVILFVSVVGIYWEVFEFGIDAIVRFSSHNILDSISDLFFDMFGGIFALLIWANCGTHFKINSKELMQDVD